MLEEEDFKLAQTGEKKPPEKQESAEKEEKKPEVKPYQVFGQDFSISNPSIIDYYKTRMKMLAIKYRLVGRVNDKAQYIVPDNIRYDLIDMEKEIEESGEDYYKAIALYMKKHFYFHIKIVELGDGKAKASLYLSEYIEDFLGMEYIVSHIADFVDVFDDDFRVKVRKAFHLVDVTTKVDDFAVPELAVLMQDYFDLELVVGGLYDMASQIFVMRMLKALEESGEVGAKVLAKYRELLAKSKDIEIDEKFRYSHYKALLDRAIDELGGYEKLGLDEKVIASIMKDINGTVKAIEKASGRGIIELDGPIKQYELDKKGSPAKSSSKGGGKSKGGSSSSSDKKPKKKDDKKKKAETPKEKKSGGGVSLMKKEEKIVLPESNGNLSSTKERDTLSARATITQTRKKVKIAEKTSDELGMEDFGGIDSFEEGLVVESTSRDSKGEIDSFEEAKSVEMEMTRTVTEVVEKSADGTTTVTRVEELEVDAKVSSEKEEDKISRSTKEDEEREIE